MIHLLAIAGRMGVELNLEDWVRLGSTMPCADLDFLVGGSGADVPRDSH